MPDANTPLGKIVRIGNFEDASTALKRFAEARLSKPEQLKTEFLNAGFTHSNFRDDNGAECQSFHWKSRGTIFPTVMLVNICGQNVFVNAGQQAF